MKKAFGILFLLIGLGMIGLGVAALANLSTRNNSFEGEVWNEFSDSYRSQNNEQQIAGIGFVGGGLIFFILGIIIVATKSKSQRKKEVELEVLKSIQTTNIKETPVSKENKTEVNDDLYTKIEKLGKLKEQGLITDEEFQEQKKKILQ